MGGRSILSICLGVCGLVGVHINVYVYCVNFWFFSEMGKFMKPGKVVLVLAGRYSGRKAVIVKVRRLALRERLLCVQEGKELLKICWKTRP